MKTTVIIALILGTTVSVFAQEIDSKDVPTAVKNTLQKTYSSKDARWNKEGDNYEVSFKQKGKETSIVFDATGSTIKTEIEISKSELPAAILEILKKDYAGYEIEEAAKIIANGILTYETELEKGKLTFDLIFDVNGKVLKKEDKESEGDND